MSPSELDHRLRAFLARGYRPTLRTHMFAYDEEREAEGWAVWYQPDGLDPDGPMKPHIIGFEVDAKAFRPGLQDIHGGTFTTVEKALAYAERELEKYAPGGRR
jgi:hypothetical protein